MSFSFKSLIPGARLILVSQKTRILITDNDGGPGETSGRFCLCSIEFSHYQRAQHWIGTRKTSLRTLNALHLACAEHRQARLISEDDALVTAAIFFGIDASTA